MHNIPGIAFSITDYFNPQYSHVESHIASIVQYALEHPLPTGTFLNVNFPKLNQQPFQGIRLQSKEWNFG